MLAEGATWRHEQTARITLQGAWFTAMLTKQEKMPTLQRFMAKCFPKVRGPQTRETVREGVLAWAAEAGLKVTRHAKPVI